MLTWVTIRRNAIKHNIDQFKKIIGPNSLLMPVIKSNAYGHGFLEIAKICETNNKVSRLCVANLSEAIILRKNGFKKPIIVLTFYELDEAEISAGIKHNIIFPLYTREQARVLNRVGERLRKKATVHFKIDIGTSRIGILPSQLPDFLKRMKTCKFISVEGIYGHFASSEDDAARTKEQLDLFKKACGEVAKAGFAVPWRHMACSAATILHAETHANAIRLGLGLYGLHPSHLTQPYIKLKPALSWLTTIIQVKTVSSGTKIGYGGTYEAKKEMKIATLPVGYWDGYDRGWSNKAWVIAKGKRCPVVGRISMNLTTIDVTAIKNIKAGDKAILLGKDKGQSVSAEDLAAITKTINYEVVTRINPTIARIVT